LPDSSKQHKGIHITKDIFLKLNINRFIDYMTERTVNYHDMINDIYLQYFPLEPTESNIAIFDFLSSKKNANLLYKKIEKVQNEYNDNIFKKMKKMKWSEKATPMFWDFQYQFKHFTLKRIRYINKNSNDTSHENNYEKYIRNLEHISSKLSANIHFNEQLQIESALGSRYYQAKALSLLVRYQNNDMGILRFKFLNKSTSYRDQGMLVSFLYALSHTFFNYEHNNSSLDLHDLIPQNEAHLLDEILEVFSKIDHITLFREPHIGKVFEKYQYAYGPNYFFMHTLNSKEGIDISKGDILAQSVLVREQKITNYIHNNQDTYNPEICYFNFIEYLTKDQELYYTELPSDLCETFLDWINEYFFYSVTNQQIRMVNMIENQVKHSLTKNIKSCHLSHLEIAEKKLEQLKKDNAKKGPYRIKNEDYIKHSSCIEQWINMLKENGRIDAGGGFFYDLMNKDDDCSKYIIDEFSSMIPWLNWKDDLYHFKNILKVRIGSKAYNRYRNDIDLLIEPIFGNKSFLYQSDLPNRSIFYRAIEKQFDAYAKWEQQQREKNKKYSIQHILKSNIKTRTISFLQSWLK